MASEQGKGRVSEGRKGGKVQVGKGGVHEQGKWETVREKGGRGGE